MAPLSPATILADITPGNVSISSSARLIGSTLPAIGEVNSYLLVWTRKDTHPPATKTAPNMSGEYPLIKKNQPHKQSLYRTGMS